MTSTPETDRSLRRSTRAIWIVLAVSILSGIIWSQPLADAAARVDALPMHGLFYQAKPGAIRPDEQAFFGKSTVVRRHLAVADHILTVTIVDGTRNRHAVHDPRHCLRGGGYNVTTASPVPLRQGEACSLDVTGPDGRPISMLFWYSDGQTRHASAWRYWLQTASRRVTRGVSGEEPLLITISTPGKVGGAWPQLMERCPELLAL